MKDDTMILFTPNPSSPLAVERGCTCSPEQNHNGDGEPFTTISGTTAHRWYLATGCPVHAPAPAFHSDS